MAASSRLIAPSLVVRRADSRGDGIVATNRGDTGGMLAPLRAASAAAEEPGRSAPAAAVAARGPAAAFLAACGGRKSAQPRTWRICQRWEGLRLRRYASFQVQDKVSEELHKRLCWGCSDETLS